MTAGTADFCYFASFDPIAGFFLDPGATPNIVKATVTGNLNITFHDGGTGDDYSTTDANFLSAGFEAGQTIVITGSVSNNITTKIKSVVSNIIYVATGLLTAEANKSATITFGPIACSINGVDVWTGTAWTAVTVLEDGTTGLTKEGFVTWNRTSVVPEKTQFNGTPFYAFWYRFKVSNALSANVNVSLETMPYFEIADLRWGKENLEATNLIIEQVGIGAASKDSSKLEISNSTINDAKNPGLMAYIKKPAEFGPARIDAKDMKFIGTSVRARAQIGNSITIDGIPAPTEEIDVKQLYETIMKPARSK